MFEGIGDVLKALFEGLDLRRRWLAVFSFVVVVGVCLLLFEQMTATVYYSSLERKTSLMKELNALEKEGDISSSPELKKVYDATVQELSLRPIRPFAFPAVVSLSSVTFWKVVSGAGVGLFFALCYVFGVWRTGVNILPAAVAIAIIGGFIGGVMPVLYGPWVNYIGFPVVQLLLLFLAGRRIDSRSSAVS